MAIALGKSVSSIPPTNTTGNSRPFAACIVINFTTSVSPLLSSASVNKTICCKYAPKVAELAVAEVSCAGLFTSSFILLSSSIPILSIITPSSFITPCIIGSSTNSFIEFNNSCTFSYLAKPSVVLSLNNSFTKLVLLPTSMAIS